MRTSGGFGREVGEFDSEKDQIRQSDGGNSPGQIKVVGIGPGSFLDLTPRAKEAIESAQAVAGYDTYLDLILPLISGKKVIASSMTQEVERCQAALEEAANGSTVAVVSSGDPGVYGMAGLILELSLKQPESIRPKVEIIPGITAAGAAAAILGAPLMNDFAVISLSDLLTPWEVIKKRVKAASEGDFVIAVYNPKSAKRITQIAEVQEIVLKTRPPSTPVGIVRHAAREKEEAALSTLGQFTQEHIDMFSLVIIGNSQTYIKGGKMITPRGYCV